MSADAAPAGRNHAFDLVVVGSGAGAMTAALAAHDLGASALLLEKSPFYGGSSAMSGGIMWVPGSSQAAARGLEDSPKEALAYLRALTRGAVPDEKLRAYVDHAPEMLRYLTERTRLRVRALERYPDYYPELDGGRAGGRSVEPEHFDARLLGRDFERMRAPAAQGLLRGRISMSAAEAHDLLSRRPGWVALLARMTARYWLDLPWRLRSKRDRHLSIGNALVGMLHLSLADRGIPLWLETPATRLAVESGRVTGVVAERAGREIRIAARRGVVLAAGGFEASQEMRERHLPRPTRAEWSCGSPSNTGDAIRMGLDAGAALALMDGAWWTPTAVIPGEERARMLVFERNLPGSILVNRRGERFVNEAAAYGDVAAAMYARHSSGTPAVPAWLVFDSENRRKYPCGPFLPSAQQPDRVLPRALRGALRRAETLEELAREIGVDPGGLEATVARMNEFAGRGADADFHRGESAFDRYYGDPRVRPNPCLAPLERPPFYALEVFPGDIGTHGGLATDASARVLRDSGAPIPGLYAIGNCAASVLGGAYPGAGGTLGPAMTFAWIAAREAAGEATRAGARAGCDPAA